LGGGLAPGGGFTWWCWRRLRSGGGFAGGCGASVALGRPLRGWLWRLMALGKPAYCAAGSGARMREEGLTALLLALRVPGMDIDSEVEVLLEPGRGDQSEAQGGVREDVAERSVERNRVPTNRNRI
jgi:hypothetical protein